MGKNDDSEERIAHTQPGSSQGLSPVCSVPGAQRAADGSRVQGGVCHLTLHLQGRVCAVSPGDWLLNKDGQEGAELQDELRER